VFICNGPQETRIIFGNDVGDPRDREGHMKSSLRMLVAVAAALAGLGSSPLQAASIIDEWASVKVPAAPALKPVTVDPKTTALLMLDFIHQACNPQHGRRCIASVPVVKKLLNESREKGLFVVFTGFGKAKKTDVVPDLAPKESEPFRVSFLDKYIGTDLQKLLQDKGIRTVITVGTAANGAVITTASESASRGFKVIVPVDGMSSDNTYAEQYTAWHLTHAPVIPPSITLTKIDMMKF
jgi:nicotinamidase-related amidase